MLKNIILFCIGFCLFYCRDFYAQEKTENLIQKNLTAAEELYYDGSFAQALQLINICLSEAAIQKSEQKRAYKLLANIMLAQENKEAARTEIKKLLSLEPEYSPTLEQETPQFVQLVTEERAKFVHKKQHPNTWIWIGAGATATAAVTAFFLLKGDGSDPKEQGSRPLAAPPAWPE